MNNKYRRNGPCHCGSGKKYKNCCLAKDEAEKRRKEFDKEFEENMTGTMLDEYMMLMRGLMMFLQSEIQFGTDSSELKKAQKFYVSRFKPGQPGGVPGTFESNWLMFDLRYGKTKETVIERFMRSELYAGLRDPGPECLKNMAASHLAFYKILSVGQESAVFEDLYLKDGKIFVNLAGGEFVSEMKPGQVWFTRLFGTYEESFIASKPYFFMKEDEAGLRSNLEHLFMDFDRQFPENKYDTKEKYRQMMKHTVAFWSAYMTGGGNLH